VNVQAMGQQVLTGVIIGVIVVAITAWMRNRNIIAPPVAKNETEDGYSNLWGVL